MFVCGWWCCADQECFCLWPEGCKEKFHTLLGLGVVTGFGCTCEQWELVVKFLSSSLQQLLWKWGWTLQKGGGVFKGFPVYLLMPCLYLNYGLLYVQITEAYIFLRVNLRLKLCCWQAQQIEWISALRPTQILGQIKFGCFALIIYTKETEIYKLINGIYQLLLIHSYFHSLCSQKSLCTRWVKWIRQLFEPTAMSEIEL